MTEMIVAGLVTGGICSLVVSVVEVWTLARMARVDAACQRVEAIRRARKAGAQ